MKKGVFLINCARGGIVNEKDLMMRLCRERWPAPPLMFSKKNRRRIWSLISLDKVICTPHLGASTDEAQTNVAIAIAEQIAAYFTTGEIKDAVNFPSSARN